MYTPQSKLSENPFHQNGLMILNKLRSKEGRGAKRLAFLINNPNQAFTPYQIYREEIAGGEVEPFLADIAIYDARYIKEMMARQRMLQAKEAVQPLCDEERFELAFIHKELQNAMGRRNGVVYTAKRENRIRAFRKPEDNRAYAALKMSMNRLFPVGSPEREIVLHNLLFSKGKFSWGEPKAGKNM